MSGDFHKTALWLVAWVVLLVSGTTEAATIGLLNGTATFSQNFATFHSPDASVDGDFTNGNPGWAIAVSGGSSDTSTSQTAVWETATDVDAVAINFAVHQNFVAVEHLIGRLRFSVTSDERSLFADGVDIGGNVTANWTVLTDPASSGPAGLTFTTQGDNSILVGGSTPGAGTYSIQYEGSFTNVTGIRLEVMEDGSLPFNGPGLASFNGNFVLTELVMTTVVPEPATLGVFLLAGLGWGVGSRRPRHRAQ